MGDPARSLAEQLAAPLPPGIEALDEEQLGVLDETLREARHRQAAALAEAGEAALTFVPGLLRGTVRKAVGL